MKTLFPEAYKVRICHFSQEPKIEDGEFKSILNIGDFIEFNKTQFLSFSFENETVLLNKHFDLSEEYQVWSKGKIINIEEASLTVHEGNSDSFFTLPWSRIRLLTNEDFTNEQDNLISKKDFILSFQRTENLLNFLNIESNTPKLSNNFLAKINLSLIFNDTFINFSFLELFYHFCDENSLVLIGEENSINYVKNILLIKLWERKEFSILEDQIEKENQNTQKIKSILESERKIIFTFNKKYKSAFINKKLNQMVKESEINYIIQDIANSGDFTLIIYDPGQNSKKPLLNFNESKFSKMFDLKEEKLKIEKNYKEYLTSEEGRQEIEQLTKKANIVRFLY
jgi:hypothetical protein